MTRFSAASTLACGAILALAGCKKGPPDNYVPQPEKAIPPATVTPGNEASLLPLDKGNQWTYAISITRMIKGQQQAPMHREWTCKITSSEKTADGTKAVMDILQDDRLQDRQVWLVNSKGIYQTASGNPPVAYKPLMPIIAFPVKAGNTFKWAGTGPSGLGTSGPHTSTSNILGSSEVDTEMGRLSAIPIESDTRVKVGKNDGQSVSTVWFAPGTGIVKLRQEALAGDTGYVLVMSLKSKSLMKS